MIVNKEDLQTDRVLGHCDVCGCAIVQAKDGQVNGIIDKKNDIIICHKCRWGK